MIVGRFRIVCRPEWADTVAEAIAAVEAPSRELPGVVHFDVARGVTDPNAFVAVEVFQDREAFERQNAQDEVAKLLSLVKAGAVVGDVEWTMWEAAVTQ